MGYSRRSFLDTTWRAGAGIAAAGLLPASAFAQEAAHDPRLIVRSARPLDLETPPHLLRSWITPNDLFFVRSHFYTPALREADWRLRVEGLVATPLELSLADLRAMPAHTAVVTLECAGNGRAFFAPTIAGVQWEKGAVGTARWTGVRVSDLLRRAGVSAQARHLWLDAADRPLGRAPDFIRDLPMEKALHPDTLIAYAMNGEPLSPAHGFPARALVPGWEGAYSVKWLSHIQVSDREHDGPFVQTSYRYPKQRLQPGTLVAAADTVPLRGLTVKSVLTAPHAEMPLTPGQPVTIAGFAWAGDADIRRVELSTDNGATWTPARLGTDRAPFAWRAFEQTWRPAAAGSYVLLSRATDDRGRTQPVVADWNPGGYLWNVVDQLRVMVRA